MVWDNNGKLNEDITFIEFILMWKVSNLFFYPIIFSFFLYLVGAIKLISISSIIRKSLMKRISFGIIGYLFLFLVIVGPIGNNETTFWIHMTQHLIIIMICAPCLLAGFIIPFILSSLPETIKLGFVDILNPNNTFRYIINFLTTPKLGLIFYIICIWTWHIPIFFNLALTSNIIHNFEHLTMFLAGILFWWPILGITFGSKKISIPLRIVYLLLAVTPTAVVAAFITLSDSLLYGEDIRRLFNISAMDDQQLGGLIMWIPGNFIFLTTLTVLFFKWSYPQTKKSRKYNI